MLLSSVTNLSLNTAPMVVELSGDDLCALSFTAEIKTNNSFYNSLLKTLCDSVIVAIPTLLLIYASQVAGKIIAFLQQHRITSVVTYLP